MKQRKQIYMQHKRLNNLLLHQRRMPYENEKQQIVYPNNQRKSATHEGSFTASFGNCL